MSGAPGGLRSSWLAAKAFFRIGYLDAVAYPLAFVLNLFGNLTNVLLYFFVAKMVTTDGIVAGDYFGFAVIGVFVLRVLGAGLDEYGLYVQRIIDQGQLELYLIQPVRWAFLPYAWFLWLLMARLIAGAATLAVGVALGLELETDRLPLAALVLALGVAATHSIGVLAGSIRIVAKRADPVLLIYTTAAMVLSGLFVPVQLLPQPLQALSWLVPHTYTVDALRQLLLADGGDGSRVSVHTAAIALGVFALVGYTIALVTFTRTLQFARTRGLLGAN